MTLMICEISTMILKLKSMRCDFIIQENMIYVIICDPQIEDFSFVLLNYALMVDIY